ncbi:hypothetical protein BH23CHL8_BH23CHL8_31490 [soil metagenome]
MSPLRRTIVREPFGSRRLVLGCSCLSLGRHVAAWEPDAAIVAELLARHEREAPRCRHPRLTPGALLAAAHARPGT